jgi:hypothetical protein
MMFLEHSWKIMLMIIIFSIYIQIKYSFILKSSWILQDKYYIKSDLQHNLLTPTSTSRSMSKIDESAISNIFSRIAEPRILLNIPGAGTPEMANCCHSGCDNCAYSRLFDEMQAGQAKWIPLYSYSELIDGRSHKPVLSLELEKLILTKQDTTSASKRIINENDFVDTILSLPVQLCLGPSNSYSDVGYHILYQSCQLLWKILVLNGSECSDDLQYKDITMSIEEIYSSFRNITYQEYGLTFYDFKDLFLRSTKLQ